jgi:hypothetical protein
MRKVIRICDLCDSDGEEREAVAWYTANDGEDYDVCTTHLKLVKESGLMWYNISTH